MTEQTINKTSQDSSTTVSSYIVTCPECGFKNEVNSPRKIMNCPHCSSEKLSYGQKSETKQSRASFSGVFTSNLDIGRYAAVALPTLTIACSELLLSYVGIWYALWGYLLTLVMCSGAPLYFKKTRLFQAFSIVSLFRLVNLGMPVFVKPTVVWLLLIYSTMLPAVYIISKNQGRRLVGGISWTEVILLPLAVVLGIVLAQIEYVLTSPNTLVLSGSSFGFVVIAVSSFLLFSFVEEAVFRGFLQRVLEGYLGRWSGLVLASALFGSLYSSYASIEAFGFAFGFGLLLGYLYDRTDSLLFVIVLHATVIFFDFTAI